MDCLRNRNCLVKVCCIPAPEATFNQQARSLKALGGSLWLPTGPKDEPLGSHIHMPIPEDHKLVARTYHLGEKAQQSAAEKKEAINRCQKQIEATYQLLKNVPNLYGLTLCSPAFTEKIFLNHQHPQSLKNITFLDGAEITPKVMQKLSTFPNLQELSLDKVTLNAQTWNALAELKKLEFLSLKNVNLPAKLLPVFNQMQAVKKSGFR